MLEDPLVRLEKRGTKSRCTVGELAHAAGVCELTIRRYIMYGKIFSIKIGGRRYIPIETAEAFLQGKKCDEVPPKIV